MSSEKKIEANRRNGRKSSGPKSDEGKSRSRLNALKHGMRANLLVLPGEDAEACQGRVDGWIDSLKPRNEAEQYLAERAARISLQLDRIERAHLARLTANINNAAAGVAQPEAEGEGEDVLTLGWRLFWSTRGPLSLYPHTQLGPLPKPGVSWSGDVDDLNNPGRLVFSLESTAKGCDWLLDRWAELRRLLEQGQPWRSPDKLKATRLLGRQPVDALYDPQVGVVFLACHQLDPSGGELFHEIWYELKDDQLYVAKKRLNARPLDWLQPQSDVEARQALFRIVAQAVERLETIAEAHRKRAEINAHLIADQLAFDGSVEGERLRRYETSCGRALLRTLDAFDKRHRAAAGDDDDDDGIGPVVPASIDECVPVSIVEVESDIPINPAFAAASTDVLIDWSTPIADMEIPQPVEPADVGTLSHCEPDAIQRKPRIAERTHGPRQPAPQPKTAERTHGPRQPAPQPKTAERTHGHRQTVSRRRPKTDRERISPPRMAKETKRWTTQSRTQSTKRETADQRRGSQLSLPIPRSSDLAATIMIRPVRSEFAIRGRLVHVLESFLVLARECNRRSDHPHTPDPHRRSHPR